VKGAHAKKAGKPNSFNTNGCTSRSLLLSSMTVRILTQLVRLSHHRIWNPCHRLFHVAVTGRMFATIFRERNGAIRPAAVADRCAASARFAAKWRNMPQGAASTRGGPGLSPRRSVAAFRLDPLQHIDPLEWRRHMMKLFTAAALAIMIIASPAFAQSYTPEVGSGNIAPPPPGYGE
jgi:hypothetical protein